MPGKEKYFIEAEEYQKLALKEDNLESCSSSNECGTSEEKKLIMKNVSA